MVRWLLRLCRDSPDCAAEIAGEKRQARDSPKSRAAVHLHFQVNAGPNAFMSKSIPVTFSDLEETLEGVDPGHFVKKAD